MILPQVMLKFDMVLTLSLAAFATCSFKEFVKLAFVDALNKAVQFAVGNVNATLRGKFSGANVVVTAVVVIDDDITLDDGVAEIAAVAFIPTVLLVTGVDDIVVTDEEVGVIIAGPSNNAKYPTLVILQVT